MKNSTKVFVLSAALVIIAIAFFRVEIFQIKVFGFSKTFDINDLSKSSSLDLEGDRLASSSFSSVTRVVGIIAAILTGIAVLGALLQPDGSKAEAELSAGATFQVIAYAFLAIDAFKVKNNCEGAVEDLGGSTASSLIECNILFAPFIFLAGAIIIAVLTGKKYRGV